jgi:hypothetical protein
MMPDREVTSATLGYFVHIQPSTLMTRALQAPPSLSVRGDHEELTYRSRESICCSVSSPQGATLHCNSADDPRFVVTSSAGVVSEEHERFGLSLYSKRMNTPEFEVTVPATGTATGTVNGDSSRVLLQPGQIVEVLRRVLQWVKIRVLLSAGTGEGAGREGEGHVEADDKEGSTSVVGWVQLFTHIPPTRPSSERSGSRSSSYDYTANLIPLKDLEFARHGQARPFMSSCGHAIHADCWDTFMASNLASHFNSRGYNRHSSVNPTIGEVCL